MPKPAAVAKILKDTFGYTTFRPGQEELVQGILDHRDVLGVMPTGAGKSLCYQVPALALEGMAVVISPLISLMKDQVDALTAAGVEAVCLNSALEEGHWREAMGRILSGRCKLLYVSPERLELEGFQALLSRVNVSMFAVDEAHCISQWGHDFRPSYRRIKTVIEGMTRRPPLAAFTATATERVREDIISMLGLYNPLTLTTGFDRPNLSFEVDRPADKLATLLDLLEKNRGHSGIVYCATRRQVDSLRGKIREAGFSCTSYHAGLAEDERLRNQEDFINDGTPLIVATVAFGMGIDKPDIRFVLHYNMPKTMEHYYQEAGRAGRDGDAARCLLLYGPSDIITNKFLIEQGEDAATRALNYRKLQEMIDYCYTGTCLRRYILRYFGEEYPAEECGSCSSCLYPARRVDITVEAQKVLSCIKRTGERFGSGLVADVLRGSRSERVWQLGFDKLSTYNLLSGYSREAINEIIASLAAEGLLAVRGGQYPVLTLNKASYEWLRNGGQLSIRRFVPENKTSPPRGRQRRLAGPAPAPAPLAGEDEALFARLRSLRRDLAAARRVPPFMIFSDATLREMCARKPQTLEALLQVPGVGLYKQEHYGESFLQVLKG